MKRRVHTRPLLQMEAVECGAAALGIIAAYHGLHIPLENLRTDCGVSRDGTSAKNVLEAARSYGFDAKGFRKTATAVLDLPFPFIVFWEYNHFLVVEGCDKKRVYLNDPALGKTWVTREEFSASYSEVVLTFSPGSSFARGGSSFSLWNKVFSLLRSSRRSVLFLLILSGLSLIPSLAIPSITRIFTDYVLIQKNFYWTGPIVVSLGISVFIGSFIMLVQNEVMKRLHTKLSVVLSYKLMVRIFDLPMSFFLQRNKAEIANRMSFSIQLSEMVSNQLLTTFFSLLSSLFFLVIMFLYNVQLSVFCLILSVLSILVFIWLSRRNESMYNRYVKESSQLSAITYSGFQTIETIKATGRENEFFSKWSGFHAKFLNSGQETAFQASVSRSIPTLLSIVNMAVILMVGGYAVMDGMMSVGMLVSYTIFFQYFFIPIQRMADSSNELQLMVSYFRSVHDVLDYPVNEKGLVGDHGSVQDISLTGKIEIRDLCFGYNQRIAPVLHGLSITISPGERVAFIGLSGSGKSTLAKLMTGLFTPWSGSIMYDDRPIEAIPKEIRTAGIGMVDQEIELFAGSVRDVLTFWDDRVKMEDVIEACRLAEIHDIISARPGGYDSLLSEGGNNFSGGQRQRLEIARALIKKPRILIMDEATSALDPETEHRIYQHVRSLGITLVIIAHRLSAIRDCDQIVVLNKGVIEHKGKHEELMVISPLYQEFLKQTQ